MKNPEVQRTFKWELSQPCSSPAASVAPKGRSGVVGDVQGSPCSEPEEREQTAADTRRRLPALGACPLGEPVDVVAGGAGSGVNECLAAHGIAMPVLNLGIPDKFIEHGSREQCLAAAGLVDSFAQHGDEGRGLLAARPVFLQEGPQGGEGRVSRGQLAQPLKVQLGIVDFAELEGGERASANPVRLVDAQEGAAHSAVLAVGWQSGLA